MTGFTKEMREHLERVARPDPYDSPWAQDHSDAVRAALQELDRLAAAEASATKLADAEIEACYAANARAERAEAEGDAAREERDEARDLFEGAVAAHERTIRERDALRAEREDWHHAAEKAQREADASANARVRAESAALRAERDELRKALETECEVSADRTWADQYHCGTHGTWFRTESRGRTGLTLCPVGDFAQRAALSSTSPKPEPENPDRCGYCGQLRGSDSCNRSHP